MKDYLTNLEARMMIAKGKMLAPFANRKAVDEGTNSGVRGTVSLVVTLVIVALVVVMALVVTKAGNQGVQKTKDFFSQLWGQFDSVSNSPN